MKSWNTEKIQNNLNQAISDAFQPYVTSNENAFEQIFDIEKNRTKKILEKLTDFDLNKDDFKLKSVEKSIQLKYSNIYS